MIVEYKPVVDETFATELAGLIDEQAAATGLDPVLVAVLMFYESGYRVRARNSATGCAGLMQIHPCHKVKHVYDPVVNVTEGCKILAECIADNDGDVYLGLRRYGQSRRGARQIINEAEARQPSLK